jgi:hypothetical protein
MVTVPHIQKIAVRMNFTAKSRHTHAPVFNALGDERVE